jgi:hypothetical protein
MGFCGAKTPGKKEGRREVNPGALPTLTTNYETEKNG